MSKAGLRSVAPNELGWFAFRRVLVLGWCTFRRVLVSWAILRSVAPSRAGLVYLLPLPGDLGQFTLRRGPVRLELGWFTFRRAQVTFRRILVNRAGLRSVAAGCAGLAYVSLRPGELGWLTTRRVLVGWAGLHSVVSWWDGLLWLPSGPGEMGWFTFRRVLVSSAGLR